MKIIPTIKTTKSQRPKPTQEEALEWLKNNEPQMLTEAVPERDWVWVRIGPVPSDPDAMISWGWRRKKESAHELPDGTSAIWYHSCQGVWRPYGNKKRFRKSVKPKENKMSAAEALQFAKGIV